MYRSTNNLLPFNKSFNFVANDALYRHETHNRSNLHVVYCRTKCRWLTVQIQGPKIWNSLPGYLRDIPSFIPFKIQIKKYILSTAWHCHFIYTWLLYDSVYWLIFVFFSITALYVFFSFNFLCTECTFSSCSRIWLCLLFTKKDQEFTSLASPDPFCTRYSIWKFVFRDLKIVIHFLLQ